MEPTLIIIGGGVPGLTAGCYARMNGYRTTIFEMGDTPGGLCTSWRRKGYLFDGSVAGLAGSAPGSPLFRLWEEIGVAKYCPLHYGENWMGAMQARKPNANMIKALLQGRPQYAYKGVKGLYMAGQWVEAWGGITTAAQSGRKAVQAMCKHDGKQYHAIKA